MHPHKRVAGKGQIDLHRGRPARPASTRPVFVEMEDGLCETHLRNTADSLSYGAMLGVRAAAADAFDVEFLADVPPTYCAAAVPKVG